MLHNSLDLFYVLWLSLLANKELWILLFPMLILVELPLTLLVYTGVFRWARKPQFLMLQTAPPVTFIVTCYSEGEKVVSTIETIVEQVYPGQIEILAVVDGATNNSDTYQAVTKCVEKYRHNKSRIVRAVPKWQRGGRVSTLNAGLSESENNFVINVDADTSFDSDAVSHMLAQFSDPNVVASGGALRVRNWRKNLLTHMQSIEYMLSMQLGKTGMADWGVLNNISGAFGAFRKTTLRQVGAWDTHTAEDLDLTMRLKQYKRRYPNSRLAFTPHAVGHTDVPDNLRDLIKQRLRWDGDLLFLFLRKHRAGLTPKLLGWGNFIFILVYGVIQNVVLPFVVAMFSGYLLLHYSIGYVAALMLLLYLTYLSFSILSFIIYIGLVSERKKQDIHMLKWLAAYPIYQFFMRMVTAFAMINELVRRGHEESSMAPWWVLKKGKRF
jgi:cellulose synthase/poly-beta-1,6-N-acetylglucosamine synthase-like glycosyltransferase